MAQGRPEEHDSKLADAALQRTYLNLYEKAKRWGERPRKNNAAMDPRLEAIAACESGGDPTAVGGGGLYRGKYQFTNETWRSLGGSGDPAAASEAEQDRRAATLLARSGAGQWPVCGA